MLKKTYDVMSVDELDDIKDWLQEKTHQLKTAQHLFNGGEASAVMLDPIGCWFPADFYPYMLSYKAVHGLVPVRRNPNYIGRVA